MVTFESFLLTSVVVCVCVLCLHVGKGEEAKQFIKSFEVLFFRWTLT